jgi:nitrilase
MIIDPWGNVLASLEMGEGVAVAEINLAQLSEVRERMPIGQQRKL